ncbi:hypothetical protein ACFWBG_34690 [Nocardia salmonicida]|uniref:hypothetical protein n=1 Tax=Nocardia salmonicida TaxID=53431 RepID=UPI00366C6AD1
MKGTSDEDPTTSFFAALDQLHAAAGRPSAANIAHWTKLNHPPGIAAKTIQGWLGEDGKLRRVPRYYSEFAKMLEYLLDRTPRPPRRLDTALGEWERRHASARRVIESAVRAKPDDGDSGTGVVGGVGTPLTQVCDPFALEVHRPISADSTVPSPVLPLYVRRGHDDELAKVVQLALGGTSAMAILVAGSSAGKTRALYEALVPLREDQGWRLWHPLQPTRREALEGLQEVGPRTVLWLNETQTYLASTSGGDERTAAGLRALLGDKTRAPVLILGTLWPTHHAELCSEPDSQTRLLLEDRVIAVPEHFTGTDLLALRGLAHRDPRLAMALQCAEHGQYTQYLAGGPELVARYRLSASASVKAIIEIAIDARRMGFRNSIPHAILEEAACDYMPSHQWDTRDDDWLERALAETGRPCRGARGPLTRIRPHPGPSRLSARPGRGDRVLGSGPVYRLAEYLEQYGRLIRAEQIPPIRFWEAATRCAHPHDLLSLGTAARDRGMYRDAAQLWKNAVRYGDIHAGAALLALLRAVAPHSQLPLDWVAQSVSVDDANGVASLLRAYRETASEASFGERLGQRAAVCVDLDDRLGVGVLMTELRQAHVNDATDVLAGRIAEYVALDDTLEVMNLMSQLHRAQAISPIEVFASRIVTEGSVHSAADAVWLLGALRIAEIPEFVRVLADRAATGCSLDVPADLARLLRVLGEAQQHEAAAIVARRAAAGCGMDDVIGVADLIEALLSAGLNELAGALADRAAVGVPLRDANAVAILLRALWPVRFVDAVRVLTDRVATDVALTNVVGVAMLLIELVNTGTPEATEVLATRSVTGCALDHPYPIGRLLWSLNYACTGSQFEALAQRSADDLVLTDALSTGMMLGALQDIDSTDLIATLANRAVSEVVLDDAYGAASMLASLQRIALTDLVEMFAVRVATQTILKFETFIVRLVQSLQQTETSEPLKLLLDRIGTDTILGNPGDVVQLLEALKRAHAFEQIEVLASRLPAAGMFREFVDVTGEPDRFRFGREPDGTPALRWAWTDLD